MTRAASAALARCGGGDGSDGGRAEAHEVVHGVRARPVGVGDPAHADVRVDDRRRVCNASTFGCNVSTFGCNASTVACSCAAVAVARCVLRVARFIIRVARRVMPVASPAAPVNRNDENVDESVSVVSSSSGITSCGASKVAPRRNMVRRVATWCAAWQPGAPCCNSVALRSAELTRLAGCKLRHVAFACGYIAPWCNIPCCTMTHAVAQHVKAAW